ncbi:MAG: SGNH hydrolase domain-containing protein [Candidatus Limnocylindrales bacterium]
MPTPARRIAVLLAGLILVTAVPLSASAADSDRDGLTDAFEARWGLTDPRRRDSDGDGIIDSEEDLDGDRLGNRGEQRAGTDPGTRDTDGDGTPDNLEDHDGDGKTNAREQVVRRVPAGLKPTLRAAPRDRPRTKGKWCTPARASSKLVKCHFGDVDSDTTIVLMGDSHAMAWTEAAWRAAEARGWHLVTLFKASCPPLRGVYTFGMHNTDRGASCRAWRHKAYEWIGQRGSKIDALMTTFDDSAALARSNGQKIGPGRREGVWATGVRRSLKAIPESVEVIVLADVPRNRTDPVPCLKRHRKDMSACVTAREPFGLRTVEKAIRDATHQQGQHFLTLNDKLCPYSPCPVVQGDTLIWRDKKHITGTIARRLTPSFKSLLYDVVDGD